MIHRPAPAPALALGQVLAVARRDLRIQRTYQFQLVLLVAEIPFVVFTYFFLGRLMGRQAELSSYAGGYFEFALIGFIVMSFATVALSAFGQGISAEQRSGTLEILLASPATSLSTILSGSLIVPVALATVEAVVFLVMGWVVADAGFTAGGALLALPLMALTVASFCALGIASAAFMVLTKRGDPFSTLTLQATTLVAGALFPVTLLPGPVRALAHLLPAFYGFDGMREVLLGKAGMAEIAGELLVLFGFAAVLLPLSVRLFAGAVRIGRITGTLGCS